MPTSCVLVVQQRYQILSGDPFPTFVAALQGVAGLYRWMHDAGCHIEQLRRGGKIVRIWRKQPCRSIGATQLCPVSTGVLAERRSDIFCKLSPAPVTCTHITISLVRAGKGTGSHPGSCENGSAAGRQDSLMSMTCVPGRDTASGLPPWPARKRSSASANSCVLVSCGIVGYSALAGPTLDVCVSKAGASHMRVRHTHLRVHLASPGPDCKVAAVVTHVLRNALVGGPGSSCAAGWGSTAAAARKTRHCRAQ